MLVGMAVGDEPAAPLGLRKMIGRSWLNQRIGQDLLEGLARDIARRERAIERVSGVAADRLDTRRMKGIPVECTPGGRLFIARADRSEERRVGKECRARGGGGDGRRA